MRDNGDGTITMSAHELIDIRRFEKLEGIVMGVHQTRSILPALCRKRAKHPRWTRTTVIRKAVEESRISYQAWCHSWSQSRDRLNLYEKGKI